MHWATFVQYQMLHFCVNIYNALLFYSSCSSLKFSFGGDAKKKLKKFGINTYLTVPLTAWFHHGTVNCLVQRWTFFYLHSTFVAEFDADRIFYALKHSVLISVVSNGNLILLQLP